MFFIYLIFSGCTVYFYNIERQTPFTNSTTTIIVNSNQKLSEKILHEDVDVKKIKSKLLNLHSNDKESYKGLIFMTYDNLITYLKGNGKFIIIIAPLVDKKTLFNESDELIYMGCKYNIIEHIGLFYCECPFERCGLFCEHIKNSFLLNSGIALCIILLYQLGRNKNAKIEEKKFRPTKKLKIE